MPIVANELPTDTYFAKQWYLLNTGQSGGLAGVDLNVLPVWAEYTGRGVTVGVYDDGLEYTHPDLDDNYDPALNPRVRGEVLDPAHYETWHQHGTHVAGVIAAERNDIGTVGIAYDAAITGINMSLPGFPEGFLVYPPDQYRALRSFDITNHSYTSVGRADFAEDLFENAAMKGRNGLGTLHFAAAGNDKWGYVAGDARASYLADLNSWADMDTVTVVAAVGHHGFVTDFSNPGHSVLVSGLGNQTIGSGIWTPDPVGAAGWSDGIFEVPRTGNDDPDYTSDFGGTSAATPMVAAVAALMLEANPKLGWRDVQTILALTARHVGSDVGEAPEQDERHQWAFNGAQIWNGGGLHYSPDYGFGLVDALAAVRLAETWIDRQTSKNLIVQDLAADWTGALKLPEATDEADGDWVHLTLDVTAALDIETLRLAVSLENAAPLRVILTSPGGARFEIDNGAGSGVFNIGAATRINAFRGEGSQGSWTVSIQDVSAGDGPSVVDRVFLSFTGSASDGNDTFVFTNEFSDYAGQFGHATQIGNGSGRDILNTAAVSADATIDLSARIGMIDGVAVTLATGFVHVATGDGDDSLTGSRGAETLVGGRGSDTVRGNDGADRIDGGAGDDTLSGGAGRDNLRDGAGSDWLAGGVGKDRFVFVQDGETDCIADFENGRDLIDLRAWVGLAMADLVLVTQAVGTVDVTWRDEHLLLNGQNLTSAGLTAADFLFA